MEISNQRIIPITILTGFLGAGKTTLLNRILSGEHGLKIAVLVNDFGAVNIDAELVVGVEKNMISLANGCVCCQLRDDLVESVMDLINSENPVEYIILEASGVAEPGGIVMTFLDKSLADKIRIDSIICVIDADQVFQYENLMELKLRQIAFSDMLILNKVDLVDSKQIEKIKAWIDDRINRVRVIETSFCKVPYEILLGVDRYDPNTATTKNYMQQHQHNHGHNTDHGKVFSTWNYETEKAFSLELLKEMIKKIPSSVYRCKGIVQVAEEPQKRFVLQVVGRRVNFEEIGNWDEVKPFSKIIAIGQPEKMNPEELKERFESCLIK